LQLLQLMPIVSCKKPSANQPLPSHLKIDVPPSLTLPPTHILAVHGGSQLLLLPIHGLVRFLYATSFLADSKVTQSYALASPKLPYLAQSSGTVYTGSVAYLPVVSIKAPSIDSFSLLHSFILSPSIPALFNQLLPVNLFGASTEDLAAAVAALPAHQLRNSAELVYGLWQNILART
jgi:hypothetical protein